MICSAYILGQLIHRFFSCGFAEKIGVKQVGKVVGGVRQFLLVVAQIGLREFSRSAFRASSRSTDWAGRAMVP